MTTTDPVKALLSWLIAMDEPDNPVGVLTRRTATLTEIIRRARLAEDWRELADAKTWASVDTDHDMQAQRRTERAPAYEVWLCGVCDSHTVDKDSGDHMCETCGSSFDHRGAYIPDPDDDLDD